MATMRFIIALLVALAVASIVVVFDWHNKGMTGEADFLLRVITACGVVFAVIVALFGDRMKTVVNRIRLTIEECGAVDNFLNHDGVGRIFCHHLLVRNHMPSQPVKNCRIWLVKILDQDAQGRFRVDFRFAVPRLMEWAPSEYSPDVRSFSEDQVFDFGKSYVDKGPFVANVFKGQGGEFRGACEPGKSRQYVFRITADNYIKARTVKVQVNVMNVEPTEAWPHRFRTEVEVKGRWTEGAIL